MLGDLEYFDKVGLGYWFGRDGVEIRWFGGIRMVWIEIEDRVNLVGWREVNELVGVKFRKEGFYI